MEADSSKQHVSLVKTALQRTEVTEHRDIIVKSTIIVFNNSSYSKILNRQEPTGEEGHCVKTKECFNGRCNAPSRGNVS